MSEDKNKKADHKAKTTDLHNQPICDQSEAAESQNRITDDTSSIGKENFTDNQGEDIHSKIDVANTKKQVSDSLKQTATDNDSCIANTDQPVADSDSCIANTDQTVADNDSCIVNTDQTVADNDRKDGYEDKKLAVKKARSRLLYKSLRIICSIGFLVFTALLLNEILLQPFLASRANNKAKSLYQMPVSSTDIFNNTDTTPTTTDSEEVGKDVEADSDSIIIAAEPTPDPNRDEMGRLLHFKALLDVNPDVKGWIKLENLNGENDTKIDYVVVQSSNDNPEYYLTRDWMGNKIKSGSLFLDNKSSVENNSQNLVIHGHNMTSTDDMFHYLLKYNDKEFYDSHPIIDFNTIYQTGQWKVFAVFITNGSSEKEPLFNYTVSDFKDPIDFLNFVYQIRIRSIYQADDIDINENDQLLTLSTCSYEVKNYRTVIVARKVRDGEAPTVNTDQIQINPNPLYPGSYYYRYGGKAPKLHASFEDALAAGEINWYKQAQDNIVEE